MITYRNFIADLRPLVAEVPALLKCRDRSEDPTFRRWRTAVQSLVAQVAQAGYELPTKLELEKRSFGILFDDNAYGHKYYVRDLSDTENELTEIINAFERYGEPGKAKKKASEPKEDSKGTFAWLWHNVPWGIWGWALGIALAIFGAGFATAKNDLLRKVWDLLTTR